MSSLHDKISSQVFPWNLSVSMNTRKNHRYKKWQSKKKFKFPLLFFSFNSHWNAKQFIGHINAQKLKKTCYFFSQRNLLLYKLSLTCMWRIKNQSDFFLYMRNQELFFSVLFYIFVKLNANFLVAKLVNRRVLRWKEVTWGKIWRKN